VPDVRLEPFAERHLPATEQMVADEEVLRFTRIPVPPPPRFAQGWLERYQQGRADGTSEAFAIVDEDGAFLGVAVAPTIDAEACTMELGYVVAPSARGRGVASEALRQLTVWAFDHGAKRVELMISVDNPASKRVAERCGYVFEGVLRSAYFKQGRRADTEIWSKLPGDP
jgi:RimJ/RimL family protein N-acetyltransferase